MSYLWGHAPVNDRSKGGPGTDRVTARPASLHLGKTNELAAGLKHFDDTVRADDPPGASLTGVPDIDHYSFNPRQPM